MTQETPFWTPVPGDPAQADLLSFMEHCARATGRTFAGPLEFHAFSVREYRLFWRLFLEWSGVRCDGSPEIVCTDDHPERARFFPGLRLNYVEHLLAPGPGREDGALAVVAADETGRTRTLTRGALRDRVQALRRALESGNGPGGRSGPGGGIGLGPGDVVAAIARNRPETVIACLASTGLGALWSSLGPDLGIDAVLGRFAPIRPAVLFADTGYVHHGVAKSIGDRIRAVVEAVDSIRAIVTLDDGTIEGLPERVAQVPLSVLMQPAGAETDGVAGAADGGAVAGTVADRPWPRFPFDHPLFVLFTSGTTGAPKCLVHGHGGTLLEHLKEHRLHSGLGPGDLLHFHTSCGWMMWNWQLSALASGTAIALYDGSASFPDPLSLLEWIDRQGVTVFGTSPAYLHLLKEAGAEPNARLGFARLRAIQSTGSVLHDAQYDWIRDRIRHVPVQSISGGSDIIGCFVLGHPLLPVHRGESQSVSLAMDVRALDAAGAHRAGRGELVCLNPFPSRPIGVHGDPSGRRLHEAYFARNEGMWTHGDGIEILPRGSARVLGRIDGTIKIHGVRIGPAEIDAIVLGIPGIAECMSLGQDDPREPGGTRLVLLVVMAPGVALDRPLTLRIKRELSQRASPHHVPAVVAQVAALPQTHNGKYSQSAAREALHGRPVANAAALRNPECLAAITAHPALRT